MYGKKEYAQQHVNEGEYQVHNKIETTLGINITEHHRNVDAKNKRIKKGSMDNYDDYPAGEPIPEPAAMHGEFIRFLTNNNDMRNTARSAIKQSIWAGSGALTGGLLMGPVGGLVGGIAGSLVGFFKADNYDGVVLHVIKLNQQQRQFLLAEVAQVLMTAGATSQQLSSVEDFRTALQIYAQQPSVREAIWKACLSAMHS
ncbi:hypothetical protein MHU86_3486 [Fragilaria crotonensis]|nr:hypothetical protein MHU86_3486 [Fragilaria crotonensis]